MPPKAADKKPAAKAPATASKAPEKKDAGKKTAPSGDKKKRTKARKETYSSYIYKGEFRRVAMRVAWLDAFGTRSPFP
jgi:histone H2B